jgi:AcrR family transcriptional regulator
MTSSKPARSGRARRRDQVRARILEIVERRLREGEAFSEISVGRIVAEAGISRTTFYVYFEDKTDLLRRWYGDVIEVLGTEALLVHQSGGVPRLPAVHVLG